jgi:flagellar motor switch protein FliG
MTNASPTMTTPTMSIPTMTPALAVMSANSSGLAGTTGVRKAAILLIQLGQERAAAVLKHLSESEVEAVTAQISQLDMITAVETDAVLGEFHQLMVARAHIAQGGFSFAQQLLESSIGEERAAEIIDRLHAAAVQMPFQFLHRADPAQLRGFIAEEHPQVIALVLAHMTPDKASLLLSGLPAYQQAIVAHRIAVMDRTSPEIIRAVEAVLERKLSSMLQPAEVSRVGGVDPLVNIINRSDRPTERQIVEGLEGLDPTLADEVKSRMFMFEDIVGLDDRSVQQVLRQVDTSDLALALKGVSTAVRNKITSNLSERAAENLLEEVEMLGAVRLVQVEEAQQSIIRTIRQLEEQGQITVRRGNDEEFVI